MHNSVLASIAGNYGYDLGQRVTL